MKLNKPKVTDTQSELEDYVANLLVDSFDERSEIQEESQINQELKINQEPDIDDLAATQTELSDDLLTTKTASGETQKTDAETKKTYTEIQADKSEKPTTNKPLGDVIELSEASRKIKQKSKTVYLEEVVADNKPRGESKEIQNKDIDIERVKPARVETKRIEESKARKVHFPQKPDPNDRSVSNNSPIIKNEKAHSEQVTKELEAYSKRSYKEAEPVDPRLKNVEKLLAKIALANVIQPNVKTQVESLSNTQTSQQTKTISDEQKVEERVVSEVSQEQQQANIEAARQSFEVRESTPLKESLGNVFQTLVFDVYKMPLAVPLVTLGGIVNINQLEITPLMGTPDWFLGLVPNERGNLMVVDTQQFLMPERKPVETKDYEYLIVLDDSQWALACHSVGDAKNLKPDDVRWSARSSKRPWFAGMVVEYMSALIEVDELINMLAGNLVE